MATSYADQPPPQYQQAVAEGNPHLGPPPAYGFTPSAVYGDEKYTFDRAFRIDKPRWNDLWAGILLILVFCGFVAVSGLAIKGYVGLHSGGGIYDGGSSFTLNSNTIILFAFCLATAMVLGYGYVLLARVFATQFIWITGILNLVFAFGTAIYMLVQHYYAGGIVFLVFALFAAYCFWTWIPRIPFSALMLRTAVGVSRSYGHVFLVSFLGGLIAIGLAAWYSITLAAIYIRWQPDSRGQCVNQSGSLAGGHTDCSQAKVTGLVVFVTFAMFWISEWLKNTIHTTVAGVYGSWYFCQSNPPLAPTRGALRRSLTYSFGSISFGSLLVAIINLLRQLCAVAQQQEAQSGDMIGCAVLCVVGCLISLLDWAVQFLNRYAFCHIALYGKAYLPAAKDTWRMIKDRGIDALVNECLINPVLGFGATFVAYACALLAYLYLHFTNPLYNQSGNYTVLLVGLAFVIGLQVANVFTTPIASGIDTIFVAAAWDPAVLINDHPELYQEMLAVYPHVQQAIHV